MVARIIEEDRKIGVYGEPRAYCPYCNSICHADFCDVGVGNVQCGPYYCENCQASEIGPNDKPRELSEKEKETGWYEPGEPLGSSANTCMGELVDHKTARKLYEQGLLDKKND